MAPIVVTQFSSIDGPSVWVVSLSVLGAFAVVASLVATLILCACGGKKKEEELPPTDQPPQMPEQLPMPEPESEPEQAPAEPSEEPISAKTAVEAKSQVTQTSEPKGAVDLQLISKREKGIEADLQYVAPAANAAGKSNQPSLMLTGQKSMTQPLKSASVKTVGGKSASVKTAGGKSMTLGASVSKTAGGKSKSVGASVSKAVGGKSLSVNPSVRTSSVRSIGGAKSITTTSTSAKSRSVAPSPSMKGTSVSVATA